MPPVQKHRRLRVDISIPTAAGVTASGLQDACRGKANVSIPTAAGVTVSRFVVVVVLLVVSIHTAAGVTTSVR